MEIEQIKRIEHFALTIEIGLVEFCDRFQSLFELPKMTSDHENETEWAEIDCNGINYNISRPYDMGKLTEWDPTVPEKCNFGISLGISKSAPNCNEIEINRIGNLLSTEFKTNIYYHRTWLSIGKNKKRNLIFEPKKHGT